MTNFSWPTFLLLAAVLAGLVWRFRHLFAALEHLRLLRVSRRQWRWIRRNKLVSYYLLFVVLVLIVIGGAAYHLFDTIHRLTRER